MSAAAPSATSRCWAADLRVRRRPSRWPAPAGPVAVIERSHDDRPRIGETLPPSARPLLARLGLWSEFLAAGHLPSPSVLSVWGDDDAVREPPILNPHGTGWHLDRATVRPHAAGCRADDAGAQPADAARGSTACASARRRRLGAHLHRRRSAPTTFRSVSARRPSSTPPDARRSSRVGSTPGGINTDRLIGLVMCSDRAPRAPRARDDSVRRLHARRSLRRRLVVFRAAARSPADRGVHDRCRPGAAVARRRRLLAGTTAADGSYPGRLRRPLATAVPRLVAANTSRLDRTGGAGWLAVGDAVAALDPLSSQGLVHALRSGVHAGEAVDRQLAGDATAIVGYDARNRSRPPRILDDCAASITAASSAGRSRCFWQRRHAMAA